MISEQQPYRPYEHQAHEGGLHHQLSDEAPDTVITTLGGRAFGLLSAFLVVIFHFPLHFYSLCNAGSPCPATQHPEMIGSPPVFSSLKKWSYAASARNIISPRFMAPPVSDEWFAVAPALSVTRKSLMSG